MKRLLPFAVLALALAFGACGQDKGTGNSQDGNPHGFRIPPDSIRGDIAYYSYTFRDDRLDTSYTKVFAMIAGVWHYYVPYGWSRDWRMPPTFWYAPGNVIIVSCDHTRAARERALSFIKARGDSVEYEFDGVNFPRPYYAFWIRLWGEHLDAVPANRPFLDTIDDYHRQKDIFLSAGTEGLPPTLFKMARTQDLTGQ